MLIKDETHSDAVPSEPESRAHGRLPDQDETDNVATEEQAEASDTSTLQGLCIAAATFIPTFLAIFLGIPYLLGLPVSARLPDVPENRPQSAMSAMAPSRTLLPSLPEPTLTKPSDSPAESPLQPRGETPAAAPIGNKGPQSSLGAPTIAPAPRTQAAPRDQSRVYGFQAPWGETTRGEGLDSGGRLQGPGVRRAAGGQHRASRLSDEDQARGIRREALGGMDRQAAARTSPVGAGASPSSPSIGEPCCVAFCQGKSKRRPSWRSLAPSAPA